MTPRRTTALVVTVALASGAGGAAVYGLADGGSNAAPAAVVTAAPTARPASAVKTNGSLSVNQIYQRTNPGVVDIKVTTGGSAPRLPRTTFRSRFSIRWARCVE